MGCLTPLWASNTFVQPQAALSTFGASFGDITEASPARGVPLPGSLTHSVLVTTLISERQSALLGGPSPQVCAAAGGLVASTFFPWSRQRLAAAMPAVHGHPPAPQHSPAAHRQHASMPAHLHARTSARPHICTPACSHTRGQGGLWEPGSGSHLPRSGGCRSTVSAPVISSPMWSRLVPPAYLWGHWNWRLFPRSQR